MRVHSLSYNGTDICSVGIENKELVVTDFDENRLFLIRLHISRLFNSNAILEGEKIMDNEIRYPLKGIEIFILAREGILRD